MRATTLVYLNVVVPRNRVATCRLPTGNLISKRGREQVWRSVCVFGEFKFGDRLVDTSVWGLSEIFFLESKLSGLSEFSLRWKIYDLI